MKHYDAYLFDLYGTLVDIHTDEGRSAVWRALAAYTPGSEAKGLKRRFAALCLEREEALWQKTAFPEIDLGPVFAELLDTDNPERIREAAWAFRRASTTHLRLYTGAKALLERLRETGARVILLSNAQALFTRPELELLGLDDAFHRIYLSSDYGRRKPDPAFFARPLEQLNLDPRRCLMLGNDPDCDIRGAAAVGMDSFYLHTGLSPAFDHAAPATYIQKGADLRRVLSVLIQGKERPFMTMNEKTKLSDILAANPWLSEELPKKDQRFAVINTLAGKMMLKTMTLGDLSRLSGETVPVLIQDLEKLVKKHG